MKAIKVTEPFKIEIVDIQKPVISKKDEVIVKITSGGICGSDMQIWNGTNSLATYPRIIGHEFGGIVTEIGSSVTKVNVGDRVAIDPVISCTKCYACRIERHNVCSALEVMGVHRDGGFAEFVLAPESNVYKFHKDIDSRYLGLVEPFTIGMEICRRANIQKGEKALIMGAGPIGIAAMQVAKTKGANVIMTDLVEERLAKAASMGADRAVNVQKEDLDKAIMEFTESDGIPIIVDTVCTAASLEESVNRVCPAGRIVVIGLKNQPSRITMADITKKELNIVGSRLNCNCFEEVIVGFENETLSPQELVTHTFNYRDIKKALMLITERPQEV